MKHKILLSRDGPLGNVLKIKPPICITKENAGYVCDVLDKVFAKIEKRLGTDGIIELHKNVEELQD